MAKSRILYGLHPVRAVLDAGRCPVDALWVAGGRRGDEAAGIRSTAERRGLAVETVSRDELQRRTGSRQHQGVAVRCAPYPYAGLEDLLRAPGPDAPPLLLALDGVQDPQNLGALLRSALALGATGALLPRSGGVGVTPVVTKASAGASEYLPVARVGGLDDALRRLKREGCWILGAEADGDLAPGAAPWEQPCVLVLGGEGRGVRRLLRARCDAMVSIPLEGPVGCLNVSAAGAILLFSAKIARQAQNAEKNT